MTTNNWGFQLQKVVGPLMVSSSNQSGPLDRLGVSGGIPGRHLHRYWEKNHV